MMRRVPPVILERGAARDSSLRSRMMLADSERRISAVLLIETVNDPL